MAEVSLPEHVDEISADAQVGDEDEDGEDEDEVIETPLLFYTTELTKGKNTIFRQNFTNGSYYLGEMKDGMRDGKGIYKLPNGSYYFGGWKDDMLHGHAIKYNAKKRYTFEGRFDRFVTTGFGVLLENGDRYEGTWKDDYIVHGKLHYAEGDIYEGEFIRGKPNGKGKYLRALSNETYIGDVVLWAFAGNGVYYYNTGERYEGGFKNNKKDGEGVFYFNDGTIYKGSWVSDTRVRDRGEFHRSDGLPLSCSFASNEEWETFVAIPNPSGGQCPRKPNSYSLPH